VVLVLLAGVAVVVGVARYQHRGEHFVPGSSDGAVLIALDSDDLGARPDASPSCYFEADGYTPEGGRAIVPFRIVGPTDGGAATVHLTAKVANFPDGLDGEQSDGGDGAVAATATRVFPLQDGLNWGITVPLSRAAWDAGANDCTLNWTSTPGAWFPNDD
jgi:hypothetical protein